MTADQSLPDFIIVDHNREVMLEFIGGSIYDPDGEGTSVIVNGIRDKADMFYSCRQLDRITANLTEPSCLY